MSEWSVSTRNGLTAAGILSAIRSAFSGATENDVSLLYYSGHGDRDGSLIGEDVEHVSPAALRSALDSIPGRKVVIVDACYSGQLINEDGEATVAVTPADAAASEADGETAGNQAAGAQQFLSAFQAAFRPRLRGALNAGSYFVITAARADQESGEALIKSGSAALNMGYFSYAFCLGCGWNGVSGTNASLSADRNKDGAVSIQEAYAFASARAYYESNSAQLAAVWPSACKWFAPFRP